MALLMPSVMLLLVVVTTGLVLPQSSTGRYQHVSQIAQWYQSRNHTDFKYIDPGYKAVSILNHTQLSPSFATTASNLTSRAPPKLLFPSFPLGPTFKGDDWPSQDAVAAVATALQDAWALVMEERTVLEGCDPKKHPSYLRYFHPDELDIVKKTFKNLAGSHGQGPDAMQYDLNVRWRYGSGQKPGQGCDSDPNMSSFLMQAYIENDEAWYADLVICEVATEPPVPQSLARVIGSNCESLKDRATLDMEVPGAAILHELLHWNEVTQQRGLEHIGDWNDKEKDPNANPQAGYGAFDAKEVNRLNPGKGHLNADNFVYFSLESYYIAKCPTVKEGEGNKKKRSFDDPVKEDWEIKPRHEGEGGGGS